MPSPLKPAEFCAIVPSGTSSLCDRLLAVFLKMPKMLCDFFTWALNDDGTLSDAFKNDAQVIPTGFIGFIPTNVIPASWLKCDGREVPRATYPLLFATIGTLYGAGDGVLTFNLPDLRDTFLVGASSTKGIGDSGGESEHTLTGDELPVVPNPSNVQGVIDTIDNVGAAVTSGGAIQRYVAAALPGPSPSPAGQPHNNLPPWSAGTWIIHT